jgi:hypothetical protein
LKKYATNGSVSGIINTLSVNILENIILFDISNDFRYFNINTNRYIDHKGDISHKYIITTVDTESYQDWYVILRKILLKITAKFEFPVNIINSDDGINSRNIYKIKKSKFT